MKQILSQKLMKLRFPLLVLVLGLILMLLPAKKAEAPPPDPQPESLRIAEARLSQLLSQVAGAGRVEVLLTLRSGETTYYEKDSRTETERREEITVLCSTGSGREVPLIQKIDGPVYRGAILLCEGARDPRVQLLLTEAVSSVTGLGTDQITVVPME